MPEEETRPIEERTESVAAWVHAVSESDTVGEMDPGFLRSALESFGADFEAQERLGPLAEYSNRAKRPGLDAVWGKGKWVDRYREWCEQFADEVEANFGKLPTIPRGKGGGRTRISGMTQFLGEITAYAAGKMDFEAFKRNMGARANNGRAWQEDRKRDRIRVKVVPDEEPKLLSSFPPGFPDALFTKMREWTQS